MGGTAPFLKWAGGKRWLFTPELIRSLPVHARYIEPFIGGGAGFFALAPARSIISDCNADLIEVYRTVRSHPRVLTFALKKHQELHGREYYYEVRQSIPDTPLERAARFLYLNRTCWNGLYRLNKRGDFNVPIGTKDTVFNGDDEFLVHSEALLNAEIFACDFEVTVNRAEEGDLVFLDPPYTVKHNMNGFVKYNESIFSWDDQVRLRDAALRASQRGARVVVTNADHASVKELYRDFGVQRVVNRASVISGKVTGRSRTTELMVFA